MPIKPFLNPTSPTLRIPSTSLARHVAVSYTQRAGSVPFGALYHLAIRSRRLGGMDLVPEVER